MAKGIGVKPHIFKASIGYQVVDGNVQIKYTLVEDRPEDNNKLHIDQIQCCLNAEYKLHGTIPNPFSLN